MTDASRPPLNSIAPHEIITALNIHGVDFQTSGCLEWRGTLATNGYGRVAIRGHRYPAHRAAYVAVFGPIDDELDTCHSCDNRRCINPHHLRPGSRSTNMLDASARGRLHSQRSPETMPRGERHGSAKLSADDVRLIKSTDGKTRELARRFGVDRTIIMRVRRGQLWADVLPLPAPPATEGGREP